MKERYLGLQKLNPNEELPLLMRVLYFFMDNKPYKGITVGDFFDKDIKEKQMYTDSVLVDGNNVKLESSNMKFNEHSLTEYLEKEASFYDYFGSNLASAERELQRAELEHEIAFAQKFKEAKDDGATDKMAENLAKLDPNYIETKKNIQDCKLKVRKLQQHLKAWDKSHDNAQSLGFILTKEMEKLGRDRIFGPKEDIESIIQEIDPNEFNSPGSHV